MFMLQGERYLFCKEHSKLEEHKKASKALKKSWKKATIYWPKSQVQRIQFRRASFKKNSKERHSSRLLQFRVDSKKQQTAGQKDSSQNLSTSRLLKSASRLRCLPSRLQSRTSRLQGVTDRKTEKIFWTLRGESTPKELESTPIAGKSTPKENKAKVRERFSTLRFESTPVERESTPMVGRSTPKKARVDSQWNTRKKSESSFRTLRSESTPRQLESTPRQRYTKMAEGCVSETESRVDSGTV